MKYRKKPVVIEAVQFINGGSWPEIKRFCPEAKCEINPELECRLIISTLEGDHIASEGDYIIKGVKGEFYPCKPDIFEMTYERVLPREHIESADCWCQPELAGDYESEGGVKHYVHREEQ